VELDLHDRRRGPPARDRRTGTPDAPTATNQCGAGEKLAGMSACSISTRTAATPAADLLRIHFAAHLAGRQCLLLEVGSWRDTIGAETVEPHLALGGVADAKLHAGQHRKDVGYCTAPWTCRGIGHGARISERAPDEQRAG